MATHNIQCDAAIVRRYLDRHLGADDESALESHLDHCAACRRTIDDSAAEDSWWHDASRFLPADEWDGALSLTHGGLSSLDSDDEMPRDPANILRRLSAWLDPTDDPAMLGRFGGYEIVGVIGEGGMGAVLKGHEPSLNRYVAIKVLAPHLASNGAARQRFSREAQAAAAVLHENVIAIHRVEESNGLPYLVMPYIAGMSLQKRLDEQGPLALVAILRIGRQIAAGLAAAHAQGLVHRDVKPANILLERGIERVTLTDFGLARAVDDATLTRSGVIAGTPQYMSPEQARGEPVDARSDLFSLGSVIYAICTGRPPFRAETSYGILRRITDNEPRPIREINPEIPDWLAAIVCRLHAKSPDDRFQTPVEVAELLEQCLAHVQQPLAVPLPAIALQAAGGMVAKSQGRGWRIGSSVAITLIVVAIGMWFWPEPAPRVGSETVIDSDYAPTTTTQVESWDDHVRGDLKSIDSTLERLDGELETEINRETEE
jgi:serine/threonine-protein kinase